MAIKSIYNDSQVPRLLGSPCRFENRDWKNFATANLSKKKSNRPKWTEHKALVKQPQPKISSIAQNLSKVGRF